MLRAIAIVCAVCSAACGRLNFDVGDDDPSGDGGLDDGGTGRPNVAFATRMLYPATFGGLADADAICMTEAASAGLPGTFAALLSTTTVNARDRIAGSRGWITTTGQALADQPGDFFTNGRALGVLNHDATGARLPETSTFAWTATKADGMLTGLYSTCGDWTSTAGITGVGFYTRSAPDLVDTGPVTCDQMAHLYCLEVGNVFAVEPVVSTGRIAFVSLAPSPAAAGVAAYDSQCQSEATMFGLPGTYLAAVATTTRSIAARFAMTSRWRRVDGTAISTDAASMFSGGWLLAPVNQEPDGHYLTRGQSRRARTGASPSVVGDAVSTCSDWTTTTGTGGVSGEPMEVAQSAFWAAGLGQCSFDTYLICLQE